MTTRTHEDLLAASAGWRAPRPPEYLALLMSRTTRSGAPCRWCGGVGTCLVQEDVSRYGDASFDVWECLECACRFTDARPLPVVDYDGVAARHAWYKLHDCDARHVAAILEQGPEHFWTYMAARYVADIPWFPDRRYRACLSALLSAHRERKRLDVLEIGCGRGVIGAIAGRCGHAYLGVDVISDAQSHALERFRRYGAVYRSIDPRAGLETDDRFDLVFSSEVIEHVERPFEFLRHAISRLKPGGTLILTTPDLDTSRDAVWNTDRPPIHTVYLARGPLEEAVRRIGVPGTLTIHNENNALNWRGLVAGAAPPPAPLAPVAPLQLKPDHADFAYAVENLAWGRPLLEVAERPDVLGPDYRAQSIRAALEDYRIAESSLIATFVRNVDIAG